MKKNWTIRLLAGVAAGAMAFSMVGCGSSKDNSKNGGKEKFIVGFDAAFPPYGYQDENGEYVGSLPSSSRSFLRWNRTEQLLRMR